MKSTEYFRGTWRYEGDGSFRKLCLTSSNSSVTVFSELSSHLTWLRNSSPEPELCKDQELRYALIQPTSGGICFEKQVEFMNSIAEIRFSSHSSRFDGHQCTHHTLWLALYGSTYTYIYTTLLQSSI